MRREIAATRRVKEIGRAIDNQRRNMNCRQQMTNVDLKNHLRDANGSSRARREPLPPSPRFLKNGVIGTAGVKQAQTLGVGAAPAAVELLEPRIAQLLR